MDERNSSTSGTGTSESSHGIADKVRERAAAQLNTQKDRATDGIGSVAQVARGTTQHLRDTHHETIARYVEQAADQLDRFSQGLKDKDVGELVEDAQRLARRQPALFVGGAFALGLAGARFFKSSPTREHREYDRGYRSGYGPTSGTETYRGAAGSGEYGRPDWRSPGSSIGASGSGTGGTGSVTSTTAGGASGATGRAEPSARRSTGEGSTRSRTNRDTERS